MHTDKKLITEDKLLINWIELLPRPSGTDLAYSYVQSKWDPNIFHWAQPNKYFIVWKSDKKGLSHIHSAVDMRSTICPMITSMPPNVLFLDKLDPSQKIATFPAYDSVFPSRFKIDFFLHYNYKENLKITQS